MGIGMVADPFVVSSSKTWGNETWGMFIFGGMAAIIISAVILIIAKVFMTDRG
jgi:hypothetical protein